ncbi:zinc-ribbon domain-containing protein [Bacillus coreaensis]
MDIKYCSECGTERLPNNRFCSGCGFEFGKLANSVSSANEVAASVIMEEKKVVKPKKKGRVSAIISVLFGILCMFLLDAIETVYYVEEALILLAVLVVCCLIGIISAIIGRKFKVLSFIGLGLNILAVLAAFGRMS